MKTLIGMTLLVLVTSVSNAAGPRKGTYVGRANAGDNTNIPCMVVVEEINALEKKITLGSARLSQTMVWNHYLTFGSDYQRNDSIDGSIDMVRGDNGAITGVAMQYKTAPGGIFNTSTISEFCIELKRQ